MTKHNSTLKATRRRFLKGAALTVAMPAIIGRAAVSTAQAAFEGESLIAVSWSGNYEQIFRETIIEPFNAKYNTKAETVGGWDQIVSQIKAAVAEHEFTALKIKVGYLMFMTADMYNPGPVGKTEKLIPMVREAFMNRSSHRCPRCQRLRTPRRTAAATSTPARTDGTPAPR